MDVSVNKSITTPTRKFYIDFISGCVFTQKQPPEVFCKKGVFGNFAKFTGKHLCQRLFFNKVAGLRPATLLKRDSGTGVFL